MRKYLVGGLAAVALAAPAVALAQTPAPEVTISGKVTPSRAGTAKKPKAAAFKFAATNSAASQTTVSTIVLDLPKGVRLDGSGLPACRASEPQQIGSCRKAKLGVGVAYASFVNKAAVAPDCVRTKGTASPSCITFDNTFYVGGKSVLTVYLAARAPFSAIQTVIKGRISAKGRRLTIRIPPSLQKSAGVFTALQGLSGQFKKVVTKRVRGKRRTFSFVSTTSCPKGGWTSAATFFYVANPEPPLQAKQSEKATQRCRR